MPDQDRDAKSATDSQHESLELNKETLGDLDVEANDVKGGALPSTIACMLPSKTVVKERTK